VNFVWISGMLVKVLLRLGGWGLTKISSRLIGSLEGAARRPSPTRSSR
jgi:hypothetical protein